MTTLARGISATATILDVSDESLNVARPFLATLDSETFRVRGLEYVSGLATRWNVDRGIDSTPATHAGGATVTLGDAAGPGGAAEPGTVVVTPPLEVDVIAALEGANAPDGANPLATLADINVQSVSRHLTSAEILALFTTPIELVAGVPGQFHVPVFAVAVYKVGTTPYTLNQTTFLNVSAIPTTMIAIANTFFLDQADDTVTMIAGLPNGIAPALAIVEGAAMSIWIDTVNPTDGDGTVDLTLLYHTIDATP